jgi:hypothetical protein
MCDLFVEPIVGEEPTCAISTRSPPTRRPKDLSTTPDLAQILSRVLSICSESFDVLPLAFHDLEIASRAANKMAHRVRKRHRPYFQKGDLCPCLSGLRVGDCK